MYAFIERDVLGGGSGGGGDAGRAGMGGGGGRWAEEKLAVTSDRCKPANIAYLDL